MTRPAAWKGILGPLTMKTIYCTARSLDGFIADANNSLDWLLQLGEPGRSYQEFLAGVGAIQTARPTKPN